MTEFVVYTPHNTAARPHLHIPINVVTLSSLTTNCVYHYIRLVRCVYHGCFKHFLISKDKSGEIFLDDIQCTARDSVFSDCTHRPWREHNCKHAHDVGVRCVIPCEPGYFGVGGVTPCFQCSIGSYQVLYCIFTNLCTCILFNRLNLVHITTTTVLLSLDKLEYN